MWKPKFKNSTKKEFWGLLIVISMAQIVVQFTIAVVSALPGYTNYDPFRGIKIFFIDILLGLLLFLPLGLIWKKAFDDSPQKSRMQAFFLAVFVSWMHLWSFILTG